MSARDVYGSMLAHNRLYRLNDPYHNKVYPKSNWPVLRRDDEGCEQWSHVRGQDDERSPDVDFARTLVEVKHVEDEHQASALGYSTKEAIQNASRHE
jgi:hypothetical protein